MKENDFVRDEARQQKRCVAVDESAGDERRSWRKCANDNK